RTWGATRLGRQRGEVRSPIHPSGRRGPAARLGRGSARARRDSRFGLGRAPAGRRATAQVWIVEFGWPPCNGVVIGAGGHDLIDAVECVVVERETAAGEELLELVHRAGADDH